MRKPTFGTCPSLPRENLTRLHIPSLLQAFLPTYLGIHSLLANEKTYLENWSLPQEKNLPGDLLPPSSRENLPGDLPLHLRLPYLNILPRSEIEKIYHKMPKNLKYFFLVLSNRTSRLINLIFNNIYFVLLQGKVRLRQFWAERYSKDMLGAKRHG